MNRLERDRASLDRTLESLRRDCAREIVPIQLPIGEERAFTGVVDLVGMKALAFDSDGSGRVTEGEVPSALADRAAQAREQLIEMVAEADEKLMEAFFAEGTLTQEQLVSGLRSATIAGRLFPLICTSGLHVIGIQPLLDAIATYVPSPAERDFFRPRPRWGSDGGHGIRGGAVLGVRVEDDRGSVRGAHHDAAHRLRNGAVGYDGL